MNIVAYSVYMGKQQYRISSVHIFIKEFIQSVFFIFLHHVLSLMPCDICIFKVLRDWIVSIPNKKSPYLLKFQILTEKNKMHFFYYKNSEFMQLFKKIVAHFCHFFS